MAPIALRLRAIKGGGVCVVVKVVNVNDPPYFNLTAPTALAIDEQKPANTTVRHGNMHNLVVDPDDPTGKYLIFGIRMFVMPNSQNYNGVQNKRWKSFSKGTWTSNRSRYTSCQCSWHA